MSTKKSSADKKALSKKPVTKKAPAKRSTAKKTALGKLPALRAALVAPDGSIITMHGVLAIDTDGTGPSHNDPDQDPKTSAKVDANGKFVDADDGSGVRFLNADKDPYSVAPKNLAKVNGGPLAVGDRATVILPNGTVFSAPIGDFGPANQVGEFSYIAIKKMGVQIIETQSGPIPTLDGANASDIHVTVTFFPGSAS